MPAGVSWPRYLTCFAVSSGTCLAGRGALVLQTKSGENFFVVFIFMIHEHRRKKILTGKLTFDLATFQQSFLFNFNSER